jgi:hypothetical protein
VKGGGLNWAPIIIIPFIPDNGTKGIWNVYARIWYPTGTKAILAELAESKIKLGAEHLNRDPHPRYHLFLHLNCLAVIGSNDFAINRRQYGLVSTYRADVLDPIQLIAILILGFLP